MENKTMLDQILGVLESFGGIIITTLVIFINSYLRAFVWEASEVEFNSLLVYAGLFVFITIFRYLTYQNRKKQVEKIKKEG